MGKINYARKLYRMLGLGFPVLYLLTSQSTIVIVSGIVLILSVIFDVARIKSRRFEKNVFEKIRIMKEKERGRISATTWFLIGVGLSLLIFPRDIAILAIALAVIGDAAAEIIGSKYRKFTERYHFIQNCKR